MYSCEREKHEPIQFSTGAELLYKLDVRTVTIPQEPMC